MLFPQKNSVKSLKDSGREVNVDGTQMDKDEKFSNGDYIGLASLGPIALFQAYNLSGNSG